MNAGLRAFNVVFSLVLLAGAVCGALLGFALDRVAPTVTLLFVAWAAFTIGRSEVAS